MRRALVLLALLALGCEGTITFESGGGGGTGDAGPGGVVPRIEIDAGGGPPPMGTDAGPGMPGTDAGPGCALPTEGTCSGDTASWCEGAVTQSQDCAAAGQVCQIDPTIGRATCVEPSMPPPTGCATPEEAAVIELANQARASTGAGPLSCDPDMARTARLHSQDMCNQNYFSHTGRDGRSPFDRMRDEGVSYRTAGENIAQGQRDADAVHNAWMNSSGHRANILNGSYGRIGVGLEECGGRRYWTQVFAD